MLPYVFINLLLIMGGGGGLAAQPQNMIPYITWGSVYDLTRSWDNIVRPLSAHQVLLVSSFMMFLAISRSTSETERNRILGPRRYSDKITVYIARSNARTEENPPNKFF